LSLDLTPLPGYAGPLLVLIDEFSASSADAFPAVLQDNEPRADVRPLDAGRRRPFGPEAAWRVRRGVRRRSRSRWASVRARRTCRAWSTNTLENNGAWPDFEDDIMTEENLLSGGRPLRGGLHARDD
jgi:hypothetical protein